MTNRGAKFRNCRMANDTNDENFENFERKLEGISASKSFQSHTCGRLVGSAEPWSSPRTHH